MNAKNRDRLFQHAKHAADHYGVVALPAKDWKITPIPPYYEDIGSWGRGYEAAVAAYRKQLATKPHGTNSAIRRHQRAGEQLCEACRLERNRLAREYHHRRRQQAANQ
jgi:hypothetical protein